MNMVCAQRQLTAYRYEQKMTSNIVCGEDSLRR